MCLVGDTVMGAALMLVSPASRRDPRNDYLPVRAAVNVYEDEITAAEAGPMLIRGTARPAICPLDCAECRPR